MERARQRRARRRRLWLALSVLVSVLGCATMVVLQHVEHEARAREATARTFATNVEQSARVLRPVGFALAQTDGDLLRRTILVSAGTLRSQAVDFRAVAPERTRALDLALDELTAFAEELPATPVEALAAIEAAARIANLAEDVAQEQRARADRAEALRTFGGMGVLGIAVLLVGLLVHRDRKLTMAIERAQVAELAASAERDPLTGLPSRLRFSRDLDERASAGTPMDVVVCDLDEFKELNHRLGHEAGDAVLITVGSDLAAAVGDDAVVYRTGGDQFALIGGPDAGLADRVRVVLERDRDRSLGSVGAARWPADAPTVREVVRLADQRMYAVKRVAARRPALTDEPQADAA